jgi:hypothetical protein
LTLITSGGVVQWPQKAHKFEAISVGKLTLPVVESLRLNLEVKPTVYDWEAIT